MTVTPAQYDLTIYQGANFSQRLTFLQSSDGDPVDLSGFTARMQLRQSVNSTTPLIELTTENGRITLGDAAGTVDLALNASETASLTAGTAVYDLEIVQSETSADRYAQGSVTIIREVTR